MIVRRWLVMMDLMLGVQRPLWREESANADGSPQQWKDESAVFVRF